MAASDETSWLNEDFKTSKSALTLSLKNLSPGEDLPAGTILQIQSVVNVSLPLKSLVESKIDYDGKRHMLKICLTDGKETIYGLLYDAHPKLSNNTVPGTKIKTLKAIPIVSRILRFTRGNVEVLGGYVPILVENWKVQKDHEKRSSWGKALMGSGDDGAPKWKSLDARAPASAGIANARELRSAKAMDILEEAKNKGDNSQGNDGSKTEFDAQRKEAISDLVKQQPTKKTFAVAKHVPLSTNESSVPKKEPREGPRESKPRGKKFSRDDPDDERLTREEKELASKYQFHGGKLSLQDHLSSFFGKPQQPQAQDDPDDDIEKAIQLSLRDMNKLNVGSDDYLSDRNNSRGGRGRGDRDGGRSGGRGDRDGGRGFGDRGHRDGGRVVRDGGTGGRGDRDGGRGFGDRDGGRVIRDGGTGGRGDRDGGFRGRGRGSFADTDSRDTRSSFTSSGRDQYRNENSRDQYSSGQRDYIHSRDSSFTSGREGSDNARGSYEDSRGYGRGGRGRGNDRAQGSFSRRDDYSNPSHNRQEQDSYGHGQNNYSRDQYGGQTPYRGGKVSYSSNSNSHENGRGNSYQQNYNPVPQQQRAPEYYAEEWPSVGEPPESANFQSAPTESAGSYDFRLGQNLVFNRSDRRKPDDVKDNRNYDGIWEGDTRGRGRSRGRGPSSRGRSSYQPQYSNNYGGGY